MNLQEILEEEIEEPKPRKKVFEPRTRKDYITLISKIVDRPYMQMVMLTRHLPNRWFLDIQSNCKEKTREQQAKFIWWFLKESKPKEIKKLN